MSEQPATEICTHDWEPFWDGSLGYTATDRCRVCGDYRPTPYTEQETTKVEERPDDDPAPVATCNGRDCGGRPHE